MGCGSCRGKYGRKLIGQRGLGFMKSYRRSIKLEAALLCGARIVVMGLSALWPSFALSATSPLKCPMKWQPFVELVASEHSKMAKPPVILFTDDNGQVYDCLEIGLSENILARLSMVSRDIARIIREEGDKDAKGFATNHCTVSSSTIFSDFQYFSIELPLDQDILSNPLCRDRVQKYLNRQIHW